MLGSLAALLTGSVEDECWPDTRENRFFILCWNHKVERAGLGCVSGGIAPSAQNKLLRPDRCWSRWTSVERTNHIPGNGTGKPMY